MAFDASTNPAHSPMSLGVWDCSDTIESRARLAVAMSDDTLQSQVDRLRRNATTVSVLSTVASLLAVYDLALLIWIHR